MTTKVQYFVAASLDGYIADAHNKIDWLTAFDGTPGLGEHYQKFLADVGALVMGARTYEFVQQHGGPWPYAQLPCYVFSHHTLPTIEGADLRFVRGELAEHAQEILAAAGGKHLWLVGGGALAAQCVRLGLLHELWLSVIPLVLGGGAPLFGDAAIPALSLQRVTQFARGIVELRYTLT